MGAELGLASGVVAAAAADAVRVVVFEVETHREGRRGQEVQVFLVYVSLPAAVVSLLSRSTVAWLGLLLDGDSFSCFSVMCLVPVVLRG